MSAATTPLMHVLGNWSRTCSISMRHYRVVVAINQNGCRFHMWNERKISDIGNTTVCTSSLSKLYGWRARLPRPNWLSRSLSGVRWLNKVFSSCTSASFDYDTHAQVAARSYTMILAFVLGRSRFCHAFCGEWWPHRRTHTFFVNHKNIA
jgi:hypothetical protein